MNWHWHIVVIGTIFCFVIENVATNQHDRSMSTATGSSSNGAVIGQRRCIYAPQSSSRNGGGNYGYGNYTSNSNDPNSGYRNRINSHRNNDRYNGRHSSSSSSVPFAPTSTRSNHRFKGNSTKTDSWPGHSLTSNASWNSLRNRNNNNNDYSNNNNNNRGKDDNNNGNSQNNNADGSTDATTTEISDDIERFLVGKRRRKRLALWMNPNLYYNRAIGASLSGNGRTEEENEDEEMTEENNDYNDDEDNRENHSNDRRGHNDRMTKKGMYEHNSNGHGGGHGGSGHSGNGHSGGYGNMRNSAYGNANNNRTHFFLRRNPLWKLKLS